MSDNRMVSGVPQSPRSQLYINQDSQQDEEASDCPLLTPSPPPEDASPEASPSMFNPLEDPPLELTPSATLNNLNTEDGLKAFMNIVNCNNGKVIENEPSSRDPMVESSSSEEGSLTKEPVCTQLLTQLNTAYQHLAPDAQAIFYNQENGGKPPLVGIQLVVPKPPKDYAFTKWNWNRIRQVCFWLFVCILTLGTTFIVRGIVLMPRRCDPQTEWWQGKVFYEIFPASFQDSAKGGIGIGDLHGISMRLNYLKGLGVNTIRLNSIFSSTHYPEQYSNVNSLTKLDENVGTMADFDHLVDSIHRNKMTLVLDIPLYPFIDNKNHIMKREVNHLDEKQNISTLMTTVNDEPQSERFMSENFVDPSRADHEVEVILKFWLRKKVDGFYLKGLEHYINQTNFINLLDDWRNIVGYQRILMCHWKVLHQAVDNEALKKRVIQLVDLVDVPLILENGTKDIKKQIDTVMNGILFHEMKDKHAWVHWSVGSVEMERIASTLFVRNASVAATMLAMILPGTPNVFYGDEIGMGNCACEDHRDLKHLHNVPPMLWEIIYHNDNEKFESNGALPWLPHSLTPVPTNMNGAVAEMAKLRENTAPIFVESALKHSEDSVNCDVRFVEDELIVIERWYPRQNTYVFVANLGVVTQTKDLSALYYEGHIVVGPKNKLNQSIYFKEFTIAPGEAYIIKLVEKKFLASGRETLVLVYIHT